ncbi:response regulator transcription factor [Arenicella xantha]|uniref:LuxR family two component transcriptional regulator n=1 Tax=Arenicella xantha TaxID=644221 RepID=A0A395JK04_9GAMM|nr:response regulator [Arenicella xantha]RBP51113.1 LuxR family two component transcriptional regulator [Arenicella xantha]
MTQTNAIHPNTIFIVDDDEAVRKSLSRSLQHHGYSVESFESGGVFLEALEAEQYGCILLDIAMPGLSGFEVQSELANRSCLIPIIFMTGHGDVPTSVRAIRNGAIEFLEKPYSMDVLFERIDEALRMEALRRAGDQANAEVLEQFETLTKREKEVMASLVSGHADKSNKEVAQIIGISHRTVEEYRSRIFQKMDAASITHLVAKAKICGLNGYQ